jgi:uncharacterized protein (DUF1778 family)
MVKNASRPASHRRAKSPKAPKASGKSAAEKFAADSARARKAWATRRRTARIEARIAPEALAVVKRAAEIQGRSLSDFVVAAAQEVAHRTIEETYIIRLSVEDQRRFVELLLNPPELAPAMKRALLAHAELIESR